MDTERRHAVCRGQDTAHNAAVNTVDSPDEPLDSSDDTFDTAVNTVDSSNEPLDPSIDTALDTALDPPLFRITQS